MRVATLNLWGLFGDWPCRRRLLAERWDVVDADVLLLQEVCAGPGVDQAHELGEALGYAHMHRVIGHRHGDVSEGVAIMSRLPLDDVRVAPLPAGDPPRVVLTAGVDGEMRLRVAVVHTVVRPRHALSAQLRAVGMVPGRPLVIGGDLNAGPERVHRALRRRGLVDLVPAGGVTWPVVPAGAWARSWQRMTGSAPGFALTPRRIDYLLGRGVHAPAAGATVIGDEEAGYASDHAVVWADVEPTSSARPPSGRS